MRRHKKFVPALISYAFLLLTSSLGGLHAADKFKPVTRSKLIQRTHYQSNCINSTWEKSKKTRSLFCHDNKIELKPTRGYFNVVIQNTGNIQVVFVVKNWSTTENFSLALHLELLDEHHTLIDELSTADQEFFLRCNKIQAFNFDLLCEKYGEISKIRNHRCSLEVIDTEVVPPEVVDTPYRTFPQVSETHRKWIIRGAVAAAVVFLAALLHKKSPTPKKKVSKKKKSEKSPRKSKEKRPGDSLKKKKSPKLGRVRT